MNTETADKQFRVTITREYTVTAPDEETAVEVAYNAEHSALAEIPTVHVEVCS